MPIFFGIPVKSNEAFRLFNLDFETVKYGIMKKHNLKDNMYMDCFFIDYLNNNFKICGHNIRTYYTDKGQFIIGYEITELLNCNRKFTNVDQFIIMLTNLKTQFVIEMQKYKDNFRNVILEHLEDEEEEVSFPLPYIIEDTT